MFSLIGERVLWRERGLCQDLVQELLLTTARQTGKKVNMKILGDMIQGETEDMFLKEVNEMGETVDMVMWIERGGLWREAVTAAGENIVKVRSGKTLERKRK